MSDPETPQARFAGFVPPKENWSKLPHDLIDQLPAFKTLGELKVVLYILRHTWGFEGTERRRISLDEFQHGRRKKDGSRMDTGAGMSKPNIVKGLKLAEQHGFITVTRDDTDKGRKSRVYELRMNDGECAGTESKPLGETGVETKPQSDRNETSEVLNQTVDHRKKPMKDTSETLPDATAPDAPVPPKSKREPKPKEPKAPKERAKDPLFDAVAQHVFNVATPDKITRGGHIAAAKKLFVTHGIVDPEGIAKFMAWYRQQNKSGLLRDLNKVETYILEYLATRRPAQPSSNGVYHDELDRALKTATHPRTGEPLTSAQRSITRDLLTSRYHDIEAQVAALELILLEHVP